MSKHPRISISPDICHGKPVIAGTRIPVSLILAALAAGETANSILEDYPSLNSEDISSALAFAGELSDFEDISTISRLAS